MMRGWTCLFRRHIWDYITHTGRLSTQQTNTCLQPVKHLNRICTHLKKQCCISASRLMSTSSTEMAASNVTENSKDDCDSGFSIVSEGKAVVMHPSSVFYNPVQEFNRDITIAVISVFTEEHAQEVREKEKKQASREKKKITFDSMKQSDKASDKVIDKVEVNNSMPENKSSQPSADKEGKGDNNYETDISNKHNEGLMETDEPIELGVGKVHEKGLFILEGLSASGLRSVRFGLEVPGVKKIIANDFSADAVEVIRKNITKNNLDNLVEASHADVSMLMYGHKQYTDRFDVIDLDPYGTAAPFLDGAVQAVRDGGLLCVTCTDAAVLCGNRPEKCFANYGAMSLRTKYCHEMALRIILQCIQSHAGRQARYIVPLISISVDFYLRIFVKVYTGAAKAKEAPCSTGMVYQCVGCRIFSIQNLADITVDAKGNKHFRPATGPPVAERCSHCGSRHQLGGPIYTGPLHDKEFIQRVLGRVQGDPSRLNTSARIEGILTVAGEELDVPLFHMTDGLCNILHCDPPPSLLIRSAILNAGYQVSFSHAAINSIKTNAPADFIWDIMRTWVKDHPVNAKWLKEGSPCKVLLDRQPTADISFEPHPLANPVSRSAGLKRFQVNPTRDWGPKPRARKAGTADTMEKRRLENQGKRRKKNAEADTTGTDVDPSMESPAE